MAGEHLNATARRVVAGVNKAGKSTIISDGRTDTRVATDAFTINQIWQMDSLPPDVEVEDSSTGEVTITPPAGGFVYLVTTFPPDSEWDLANKFAEAMQVSGGSEVADEETPGMHQTDTVDIVTVISGEMYAVTEDGEVRLTPGDSFVQRGTKHAWSNRSDGPCTIVAVMTAATRG